MTLPLISTALGISLAINAVLYLRNRRPKKTQSIELQEFLGDLMTGKFGMIAVARVNPDDILLRSPKK